jgi:hypothetical protein
MLPQICHRLGGFQMVQCGFSWHVPLVVGWQYTVTRQDRWDYLKMFCVRLQAVLLA